ncbi:hypothetical protein VPH35_083926 [Triticum aestivum]
MKFRSQMVKLDVYTRFMDGTFITSTHFTSLWKWHFHCYSNSFRECSLPFVQVVGTYTATLAEDVLITVKPICKPLYPLWALVRTGSFKTFRPCNIQLQQPGTFVSDSESIQLNSSGMLAVFLKVAISC